MRTQPHTDSRIARTQELQNRGTYISRKLRMPISSDQPFTANVPCYWPQPVQQTHINTARRLNNYLRILRADQRFNRQVSC